MNTPICDFIEKYAKAVTLISNAAWLVFEMYA